MSGTVFDLKFGREWRDVHVELREGRSTSVTDYHRHAFYEINLILSGNVKILLRDRAEEGAGCRIVLTRPGTPHYITCRSDALYSRLYLLFSEDFVADRLPEWQRLAAVFGAQGTTLVLTETQTAELRGIIERIGQEPDLLGQRLLIYYLLNHLSHLCGQNRSAPQKLPAYVIEAISYIELHYAERLRAEDIAKQLHIGRTTLMLGFKRHTDRTLSEYLTHCRLGRAMSLLCDGQTLEYAALQCGFSDTGGLIRACKRCYGTTPHKYAKALKQQKA